MNTTLQRVFIALFFLLPLTVAAAKVPRLIKPQEKVYIDLCELLEEKLARDIEILVYEPDVFNTEDALKERLVKNLAVVFELQKLVRSFNTIPIEEALEKKQKISREQLEEADHTELIAFAAILDIESVLMLSMTLLEGETRKVWDKKEKKWLPKQVVLLQGNVFKSSDGSILIRFSYYFYIE